MRAMRIAWNKTHIQVAHLLGHQASHESANFTRLVENTNSAQGMANNVANQIC
jgi:predicted chitinase